MGILNNIWNTLNTEKNEMIIKLNGIPSTFIEIYLTFCIFTIILKTNYTKKQKYVYIVSVSTVSIVSSLLIPEPYNVFINHIFIFLLLKKYLRFNTIQVIFAIIIPLTIFGLVNSLLLNPFFRIFNISYENGFNTPIYRISYLLFIELLI